ncbi:MAG: RNA polymerase sigma factor [Saprospiraceae bacterium]
MAINPTLIKDCARGDRKAQFQLYKSCYGLLMSVCLRYRKQENDAVEMLNVGFMKILTNLNKYQDHIPFEAWSRRIMINTLIDDFRKNRKVRELIESTDFEHEKIYNDSVDYNEADLQFDADELQAMINQLPRMSGKVFNLFAIDGYSHKEIGKMLGISDGTSKWHLSFARKKLQGMIKEAMKSTKVI